MRDDTEEKAVREGAALLTNYFKNEDWIDRLYEVIQSGKFNIGYMSKCVIGTLFPQWNYEITLFRLGSSLNEQTKHGFDTQRLHDPHSWQRNYEPLQLAWTDFITAKHAERVGAGSN